MKNLKLRSHFLYTLLCVVFLTSCNCDKQKEEIVIEEIVIEENNYEQDYYIYNDTLQNNTIEDNSSGIGITTSGKLGVEVTEGLYINSSGELELGFGL